MAKDETKRLSASALEADKASFEALETITNYAPANTAYTSEAVQTAHEEMLAAQAEETRTAADADTARDNAVRKEWVFHNVVRGVKDQVTAQFGRNSNEVQALGRKKESEYKPRTRKRKPE